MVKFLIALTILLTLSVPLTTLAIHEPGHEGVIPCGANIENGQIKNACTLRDLFTFVISAINLAIQLSGVVTVIMVIIGGGKLMDAAVYGNPEAFEDGKKTIINSLVGLGLVLLSYVIVNSIWTLFFPGTFGATWFEPWK